MPISFRTPFAPRPPPPPPRPPPPPMSHTKPSTEMPQPIPSSVGSPPPNIGGVKQPGFLANTGSMIAGTVVSGFAMNALSGSDVTGLGGLISGVGGAVNSIGTGLGDVASGAGDALTMLPTIMIGGGIAMIAFFLLKK